MGVGVVDEGATRDIRRVAGNLIYPPVVGLDLIPVAPEAAALAALFTLTSGVALLLGLVAGVVGMNVTSRPHLTGRVLVPIGVLFGLVALVLVALRYAQVHGAFGDEALPVVADMLQRLNMVLRIP